MILCTMYPGAIYFAKKGRLCHEPNKKSALVASEGPGGLGTLWSPGASPPQPFPWGRGLGSTTPHASHSKMAAKIARNRSQTTFQTSGLRAARFSSVNQSRVVQCPLRPFVDRALSRKHPTKRGLKCADSSSRAAVTNLVILEQSWANPAN